MNEYIYTDRCMHACGYMHVCIECLSRAARWIAMYYTRSIENYDIHERRVLILLFRYMHAVTHVNVVKMIKLPQTAWCGAYVFEHDYTYIHLYACVCIYRCIYRVYGSICMRERVYINICGVRTYARACVGGCR